MNKKQKIKEISDACINENSLCDNREKRLADLLYVIQKYETPVNDNWYKFTESYNLIDDNLDNQSDFCIDFLYNLIINRLT